MKLLHILCFLAAMLLTLVVIADSKNASSSSSYKDNSSPFFTTSVKNHNSTKSESKQEKYSASLRGTKGFHGHKNYGREVMTCDKYPRVCRGKGSQGPDCCRKKCVNVSTDRNNCGKCGKRCKYSQMCCRGKCVNVMFDKHHCGSCGNKCGKGDSCLYGICNYA